MNWEKEKLTVNNENKGKSKGMNPRRNLLLKSKIELIIRNKNLKKAVQNIQ